MRLLDRYLGSTVIQSTAVVLLVMLSLDLFFNLLEEMEDLGEGGYGTADVTVYLLLTLPRRIYETLPMALLVGGLLGLGGLAAGSELTVLRAAGVSKLRLVGAALRVGLVLSLGGMLLGEFIAPETEKIAQRWRAEAQQRALVLGGSQGFWARDGQHVINIRGLESGLQLRDIYIFEMDERARLQAVTHAARASYRDGDWLLEDVSRSRLDPVSVSADSVASIQWRSVITPQMLEVLAAEPEDLALRELATYIEYLSENRLDASQYRLALWSKLLAPATHLTMLFVGMPLIFGSQRSTGVGQRLLAGALLGLGFYLLNRLLGNVVLLYGLPPWLGAALPPALFAGAGAWALHRQR